MEGRRDGRTDKRKEEGLREGVQEERKGTMGRRRKRRKKRGERQIGDIGIFTHGGKFARVSSLSVTTKRRRKEVRRRRKKGGERERGKESVGYRVQITGSNRGREEGVIRLDE